MSQSAGTVFIIDDDLSVRRSTARLVRSIGLHTETFPSAQEFLLRGPPDTPSCLVLDVRMPGLSGLDLQEELSKRGLNLPIVFITGHGDIPMSVQAMKKGAVDFLPKPFKEQDLLHAIQRAIERDVEARRARTERSDIQRRVDSLTYRQKEVFALIVTGMLNKQVAGEIGNN